MRNWNREGAGEAGGGTQGSWRPEQGPASTHPAELLQTQHFCASAICPVALRSPCVTANVHLALGPSPHGGHLCGRRLVEENRPPRSPGPRSPRGPRAVQPCTPGPVKLHSGDAQGGVPSTRETPPDSQTAGGRGSRVVSFACGPDKRESRPRPRSSAAPSGLPENPSALRAQPFWESSFSEAKPGNETSGTWLPGGWSWRDLPVPRKYD